VLDWYWISVSEYSHRCTHTHPFDGPFSGTTRVSRYQKGKTNLDFTVARDSEWQWHQLGHTQVCTSLQTGNHASNPPLSFLQAGCLSCHPTNSVKALQYRWIQYIGLRVSADTDMSAVAIMIGSNRTRQASGVKHTAALTEMRLAFLFTFRRKDCRCDVRNSGEAEQTSNRQSRVFFA